MTVVIVMQVLVAALAGLILLERWLGRDEIAPDGSFGDWSDASVEFHPELIMRWDDEADYARPASCTRPVTSAHRRLARPLAAASQPQTPNR